MSEREAYRPVVTEGVVKNGDINFLRFVLPDENLSVEILKDEGEYLSALDTKSRLPKGYAMVRVTSATAPVREFREDWSKIQEQSAVKPIVFAPPATEQKTDVRPLVTEAPGKKQEEPKPNPAAFEQFNQRKSKTNRQSKSQSYSYTRTEQTPVEKKVNKPNVDSLGYFKVLNLNPTDLVTLTQEEAEKMINKNYRVVARAAHPDMPGGSEMTMKKINNAKDVISKPSLRTDYMTQTGQFAPRPK